MSVFYARTSSIPGPDGLAVPDILRCWDRPPWARELGCSVQPTSASQGLNAIVTRAFSAISQLARPEGSSIDASLTGVRVCTEVCMGRATSAPMAHMDRLAKPDSLN
jgi:hypothetical protein